MRRVRCLLFALLALALPGVGRVEFMFLLGRFGLSAVGVDPEELRQDLANA